MMRRFTFSCLAVLIYMQCAHADTLADPTQPMDPDAFRYQTSSSTSSWSLTSTLVSNGRRVALINGTPKMEGDTIGAARVVRIKPSEVHLESASRRITLRLIEAPVRTRTAQP